MSYPGVRFTSSLRQSRDLDAADLAQESVDLLQITPDVGCTHRWVADPRMPSGHQTPVQSMRALLAKDDQMRHSEDNSHPEMNTSAHAHVCQACSHKAHDSPQPTISRICQTCSRDSSIYYNHQGEMGNYDCHNENASDTTRDGSVYFNYLQLTSRSRNSKLKNQKRRTDYEPIKCGAAFNRDNGDFIDSLNFPVSHKSIRSKTDCAKSHSETISSNKCCGLVFGCYTKINLTPSEEELKTHDQCNKNIEVDMYGSSPLHHQPPSYSPNSTPGLLNNNRTRKVSEWPRPKRLLFLVGILLGILIALGGIVVGFVILVPNRNTDKDGVATSSAMQDEQENQQIGIITIIPTFEQPVKDADGWVYFAMGSGVNTGSRYTIINRVMMFSAAQQECRTYGGHPPFITSLREQVFLEDFIAQELINPDIQQDAIGFWLGARRARGSHSGTCLYKQWKWVDVYGQNHGIVNGFTAFAIDKPDNYFNPEECLYLSFSDASPDSFLKWDDAPCDIPTIGNIKVICEVDDR